MSPVGVAAAGGLSLPAAAAAIDPWGMLLACSCVAVAIRDLLDRIIPNRLCAAIFVAGLCAGLRHGPQGLGEALGGAATAAAMIALPYLSGALGGGDAKAFTALAAFLSPKQALLAATSATLLGGLVAGCVVAASFHPLRPRLAPGPLSVPYAVAICAGCAWARWSPAVF